MTEPRPTTVLRARYVFPGDGPPLADAIVAIEGSRIIAVAQQRENQFAAAEIIDLGNAAIIPGLVNAHTHLEFSDLTEPLSTPGASFADWIQRVVAYRRSRTDTERHAAIRRGLAECARAGTVAIGEIASGRWLESVDPTSAELAAAANSQPPDVTVFHELIGLSVERAKAARAEALNFLNNPPAGVRLGLSPHAPYSVQPKLVGHAIRLARARRLPVAMHLAESPDEMQLLREGDGPLRDLFLALGVWDPTAIPRVEHGSMILAYLRSLSEAERALVIHGTLLNDEEIQILAWRPERMAVVYCPRTHARFGFASYPLDKLLAAGATVALGTDSRASNPDLSLLDEVQFVAARGTVEPQRLLRMATLDGAKALGLAELAAPLTPGRAGELTIVGLPPGNDQPWELLFDPRAAVVGVVRDGILERFVR